MWTDVTALQQYFPLTGTTFWIDHQLWGEWTLPYHMENVLLHVISALLFWRLLVRLAVPGARLAGAIFVLHPVMVESVAWITERKNVLSLVFYLAALLVWLRSRESITPEVPRWRRRVLYMSALLLLVAALMAKATAFSFPAVALVLVWWKEGHVRLRNDVLPLLPFFLVVVALGLLIRWLEVHHVGADGFEWPVAAAERPIIAGRAIWFYLGKLLWPAGLVPIYPRWEISPREMWQWMPLVLALMALCGLWLFRRKTGRGVLAAVLIYTGALFPVLGFLNVYGMAHSFVADRWVYVSSLAVIGLFSAGVSRLAERLRFKVLVPLLAMTLLPTLAFLTSRKAVLYRDDETLMSAALAGNSRCWLACYNLANYRAAAGDHVQAEQFYKRAIDIWPGYTKARLNYGNLLTKMGRLDEGISMLESAVASDAALSSAQYDRGLAFVQKLNLGLAYTQKGRFNEAEASFEHALNLRPDYPEAHQNLAFLLYHKGDVKRAIDHYRRVTELLPSSAEAHRNLAVALMSAGDQREAIRHFEVVLQTQPNDLVALNGLARTLSTSADDSLRNGTRALELALRADELVSHGNADAAHTLAAAYAENGQFVEALSTSQRALNLAEQNGADALAFAIRESRKLYLAGKPLREPTSAQK